LDAIGIQLGAERIDCSQLLPQLNKKKKQKPQKHTMQKINNYKLKQIKKK